MPTCSAARAASPLPACGQPARSSRAGRRAALTRAQRAQAAVQAVQNAPDAEERLANEQGEQLRRWVTDAGGVIHPALLLSFATPHGRGIVAATPISLAEAQQQPLIAVPERLLLTTEAALQCMGPALQPRRRWWELHAAAAPPPDPPLLLALLLASERRKGGGSFWWPYIAALPEEPPCAWAMPPACLGAALEELGSLAAGWGPAVRAASAAVDRRCEAAAAAYGAALGGVTAADMRWALGHVVSRSFGSGTDLALLPFIDLCNHRQHAAKPQGYTREAGQECAAISSEQRGEAAALAPGEQLCVSYAESASPLQMFLNFGFCAAECRGESP